MDISLKPGRYVVAVSGGVDSMALLHLLHGMPGLQLIVAHFDHGIRDDSREDRLLVQETAGRYGLPFVYDEGKLGRASEETARKARYGFLHHVREAAGADAIVTAHHKDDALETAVINMIRGTGRKGLASLQSIDVIKRPLLAYNKQDLLDYARTHKLSWREDSTNADTAYLRNHIRQKVLGRLSAADKQRLHAYIEAMRTTNDVLDTELSAYLEEHTLQGCLDRKQFIVLPHAVALEVMAAWLRSHNIRTFDKKMLERLTRGAKIHSVGSTIPVNGTVNLRIGGDFLALKHLER